MRGLTYTLGRRVSPVRAKSKDRCITHDQQRGQKGPAKSSIYGGNRETPSNFEEILNSKNFENYSKMKILSYFHFSKKFRKF